MKGYSSYYKKKSKKIRFFFLTILVILVAYIIIKNITNLPFLNLKKKKYSAIEEMLVKHDKEKKQSQKKIIINKANKILSKLINDPDFQEDGYLAYLAGTINFRKGLLETNKDLKNMYLDKALYHYRKAMALLHKVKNNGRLHYELGKCYFYKGEYYYYESLLEFKKAKMAGYSNKNIDKIIAIIKYKKGEISDITHLLDQFKNSKENDVENYFYKALTYKNNKDYDKAKESFLKIEFFFLNKNVEIGEKKYIIFRTLYSLGWLFYNEQNFNKAEEYYNKALLYEENNADIYYWLGKVYKANKSKKKARKMWEKTLQIDPEYKYARIQLKKLRRGR